MRAGLGVRTSQRREWDGSPTDQTMSKQFVVSLVFTCACVAEVDIDPPPSDPQPDDGGALGTIYSTTDYVARWKLDEATGTTANDSLGVNGLTLKNNAAFATTGKISGSLTLDGVDDYAVRTTPSSALKPTTAFSIAAWVKLTTTDSGGSEVASMGDNYGLRIAADGNVKSWFWDTSTYHMATTSGVNVKDGAWHHLVGQYDGSRVQVFVDGALKKELAITGAIAYARGTSFVLGRHGNGDTSHDFNGSIDDVRVYNHALTAGEVASLTGSATLKVLQWNTSGPLGSTAIQLISDQQPNVVFLEEVDSPTLVENLRVKLQSTYGGTWEKQVIARGTDTTSSYVAIVSQFHMTNVLSLVLRKPGTYVLPCYSSTAVTWAGRATVGANISVAGRNYAVFGVRTTSEGDRGCARQEENTNLKAWANTNFAGTRIYGGDFNMQPYSTEPEYQLMLGTPYAATDSWKLAVDQKTAISYDGNPTYQTPTRNTRMDYIFYDQGASNLAVRSSQILDEGSLSDHRMMITTFGVL